MKFETLPESVQQEVRNTLFCFNRCFVEKTGDKYEVVTGLCLHTGEYAETSEFKKDEIHTIEEWKKGFKDAFGYEPSSFDCNVKTWAKKLATLKNKLR